ncbi:hypothetical protein Q2366_25785, partial [Escherichia coli]|nr:hypothetical protein [Escherichia coli]
GDSETVTAQEKVTARHNATPNARSKDNAGTLVSTTLRVSARVVVSECMYSDHDGTTEDDGTQAVMGHTILYSREADIDVTLK